MENKEIKLILVIFLSIILIFPLVSASELTVTSVSPANIIKNGDSVSGEILVDTTINGGGQSFMATLNPQDVRNFQSYGSDKPYPANSIQLEVTNFEEYVFYNIVNNYLGVYEYQANEINTCPTSWLGYCNADAPSCSNGAEGELRDKSNFNNYIEERVCIKKEQVATLGNNFDSSVIKFNANVKVSSGGKTKSKIISSGNEGQNAIDLGEAGVATWTGSKISGVSIPSVINYLPLLQEGSSNWKVISNQKKINYEDAKGNLEYFLSQNTQIISDDSDFLYKKNQLTSQISTTNNQANYLVNDLASLDYSYSENGGQEGIIIDLTNRVTLPEILFRLKASWIGIIIPSGQPKIVSVNADKFYSGQAGTIEVVVENVGEANGVFSVRLVNCEPFIVPETSISSRTNVAKGSKETIGIPISSGTLSEELSKTCSVEVYDINEPSHKDSAPLTLELGTAKICEPNKVFVDGNIIKKCDSKGKNIEILKECPEGVKLYEDKGWDCVGEGKIPEEKTSECEEGQLFSNEDSKCVNLNNLIGYPSDTPCISGWPNHQGDTISINEINYACDLFEVNNPQLKRISQEVATCFSTKCGDNSCNAFCKQAYKQSGADYFQNTDVFKKFAGLYIIYGLGPAAEFMQNYFNAEINCGSGSGTCSPKEGYNNNVQQLQCKSKVGQPEGWSSDADINSNSCLFSDLPAHVNIDILHTGTCVDYSVSLTTLLRYVGYKNNEVYSVTAPGHEYNFVKFPGDNEYTIVDTVGNSLSFGKGWSWSIGDKNVNHCDYLLESCANDNGQGNCPSNQEVKEC